MFFSAIIFIFTLLILVLIHELGHFLMAKRFGIKVEEFGFGLPPRAWGKKFGETIYSLNWLPFGGFVRLLGEDEITKKDKDYKRSFAAANVWKRILVVVTGVAMNFLFAFLLFYIVLSAKGFNYQVPLLIDHQFIGAEQQVDSKVFIGAVAKDSPAEKAGVKIGDQIIALDEKPILSDKQMVEETKSLAGHEISLTLKNSGADSNRVVKVIPRENPPQGEGALGIALQNVRLVNLNYKTPWQKAVSGITHSYNVTTYSLRVLGSLIQQSFIRKDFSPLSSTVAGPVGITSIANSVLTSTDKPLIPYLDFMAMLSLNLAIINILPIPAMDGGRLFFLLIEALTRKKVHPNIEKWVHSIGMAVLLLLTLLITASDIKKFFP